MDVGELKSYGTVTSEGEVIVKPAPVAGSLALEVQLYEDFDNGTDYVGLKAPSAMAAGTTNYTLPDAVPSADGQALVSTTGGVMSWSGDFLDAGEHRTLDQLVHNIAENSYEEYTYSASFVTNIDVWTDAGKTLKIRDEAFTYASGKVSQIVTQQYDGGGAVVETMTESFTYSGNKVTSITRTFV